jgi:MerR-like DNA binding protein
VRPRSLTRAELARLLERDEAFLVELERHEIVAPDREGRYDRISIERARLCCTMHDSLGLNLEGIEVALHLLEAWQADRRRVRELLLKLRDELDMG